MKPFFGDPNILAKYRNRMAAHIAADELVQRVGFDEGKGCFVGCTLDAYDHDRAAEETNIPVEIWHVCDAIHEGLPKDRTAEFATRFFEAVNLGGNADTWWPQFAIALLVDPENGIRQYADDPAVVDTVAKLYLRRLRGDDPTTQEWAAARDAAWAARDAAGAPAGAADGAAAWAATWDGHCIWQAETLIRIIQKSMEEVKPD